MKRLLCLLLLHGTAYGQTFADSSLMSPMFLAYKTPQRTTADTAQALHLLFRNQRAIGGVSLGLSGLALIAVPVVITASTSASASPNFYRDVANFTSHGGLAFAVAIPMASFGAIKLLRSSKKREDEVIYAYVHEHILPKKLRRKLKPELFIPAVSTP